MRFFPLNACLRHRSLSLVVQPPSSHLVAMWQLLVSPCSISTHASIRMSSHLSDCACAEQPLLHFGHLSSHHGGGRTISLEPTAGALAAGSGVSDLEVIGFRAVAQFDRSALQVILCVAATFRADVFVVSCPA